MTIKNIKKRITGQATQDGAGVKLIRVLGYENVKDIDPFLMLDAFDSTNPEDYIAGFPMHPHRGIETITYLIEGHIEHKDSLGNGGTIHKGESQWMTAGSGIMHEEMPKEDDRLFGLQIWLNLPKKDKMTDPNYFDIKNDMIKEINIDEGHVRVISGEFNGHKGITGKFIKATLIDFSLKPNNELIIPVNTEDNAFVYVFEGNGYFGNNMNNDNKIDNKINNNVENKTVAIFDDGDEIKVKSGVNGIRFLLFAGKPLKEPIAWGGPIVMNDESELINAFDELQNGKFIKNTDN
ncbi:MAG: pirin family protein [Methanobrevibacter sp.]|jgi:redox-sensitive bicupin YhaK (pirin superfamily)|nr:pirin family protein [Candidatus Methanoflexus mossambicus]